MTNYPLTSDGKDKMIKDLESKIQTLQKEKKELEEQLNDITKQLSITILNKESKNQQLSQTIEKIRESVNIFDIDCVCSMPCSHAYAKQLKSILDKEKS